MKKTNILRVTALILVAVMCFSLASCVKPYGTSDNAIIDLGDSDRFSRKELEDAVECVKQKFKEFTGCNMTRIWYDEKLSERELRGRNCMRYDNSVVLFSDFTTNKYAASEGFETDFEYTDWSWELVKNENTSNWQVVSWGLG
ncbi:MAG: hypothetical protein PUB37_01760 [Firmicutes bacterium]|nr:hypothetical protein [Bacillota bacterium]